jgi:parallel beta-helix repeat protein
MHRFLPSLLIIALTLAFLCLPVTAAEHTVAPSGADFITIKDAIDWSASGDTILVKSGTYTENLKLDKQVSLVGVDTGGGAPVIETGRGDAVTVLADGCTIDGFTVQSGTSSGIRIMSDGNTIRNNTIRDTAQGIAIVSGAKNTITGNEISDNNKAGIALESSSGNLIEKNVLQKNTVGISLDESSLANSIFRNTFVNPENVVSQSPDSVWSSPATFTYTYLGLSEESRMGNYWSDYSGQDKNGDGIGDTPYVISLSAGRNGPGGTSQAIVDSSPLMDPPEYYTGVTQSTASMPVSPSGSTTLSVNLAEPVPSGATAPAARGQFPLPIGVTGIAVALLLVAATAAGVYLLARKKGGTPADARVPVVTVATRVLNTVAGRTRSLLAFPAAETIPVDATGSSAPPSATEKKNYFPRELENKYTGIRFVGRGGIAWVFSACRKSDQVRVAVKIPISFDEVTGKCFLNEIAAWETLRHPNIVEVTAVNILPVPYVEMEFVAGSLEGVAKPMPVWKAVHLITGVAEGLRYAHGHGFIHRDIKPHNILLTEDLVPKITDWGMSKVLAADVKKSSVAGFSLSYAAPEQVSPSEFGRTDERTDIYQLGVVFYELVTGSIPFGGESIVEVGNAILRETPVTPSEFNPGIEAVEKIILKCLEKDPAQRYQSTAELLDALHGYLDEDED